MNNTKPTPVGQMLHGYRDGHRELARFGRFSAREASLMDRLSDLSGYVPMRMKWSRYLSGYPLGQDRFSISATWPDHRSVRTGAVLTHTVVFDREEAAASTLQDLSSWLRKPRDSSDREAYLEAPEIYDEIVFGEASQRQASLIFNALARTSPDETVVWCGPDDYDRDSLAARIWRWSTAGERRALSFCTMALGDRQDFMRFRLMFVPDSARMSAFSPDQYWVQNINLG